MFRVLINYKKIFDKNIKYYKDKKIYNSLNTSDQFKINDNNKYIIYENEENAGKLDEHYFLQDLWMARKVIKNLENEHYDVGSRIDGFISHLLSANLRVNLIDIRKLPISIDNLSFVQADATNLESISDESIESISSLHAIEHFGLGRYGDPINPDAWRMALESFSRVLKRNGKLYLSVPVGSRNILCYNAHRIFMPSTIINALKNMKLVEFAFIKNFNIYQTNSFNVGEIDSMINEDYLCGLFIFTKI